MKIGYVGLGKMGKNMVFRLLEQGVEVVVYNRTKDARMEEVVWAGAIQAESLEDLVKKCHPERSEGSPTNVGTSDKLRDSSALPQNDTVVVWLMLTAGNVVDEFVDTLANLLSPGDLLIDGGNSFYQDTLARSERLRAKDIHYMDVGTSGGPKGARDGACLMVGGSTEDYKRCEELFKAAAAPEAYELLGPVGAGHFAKMVHNGVEYGMMQAIAEGLAVLEASNFNYDLAKVLKLYNNRSVIESRLVGWTKEALDEDPKLESYSSSISHTGEGEWTIKTAKEFGVEIPVIEKSFQVRVESEGEPDNIRNRAVSAMRGKFGGHAVKR